MNQLAFFAGEDGFRFDGFLRAPIQVDISPVVAGRLWPDKRIMMSVGEYRQERI